MQRLASAPSCVCLCLPSRLRFQCLPFVIKLASSSLLCFPFFFPSAGNDVDSTQEKLGGQQQQPRFPSEALQEQGQCLN